MNKKTVTILALIVLLIGCYSKDVFFLKDTKYSCRQLPIEITNVPNKKGNIAFALLDTTIETNVMGIYFGSGFNRYVKTFINDSLIFDENLRLKPHGGLVKSIMFNYSSFTGQELILRIIIDNKYCITTNLNLKYRNLYLKQSLDKWDLIYNDNNVNYY